MDSGAALFLNGERVHADESYAHAPRTHIRVQWPLIASVGEYVAAVFQKLPHALQLHALKVYRVTPTWSKIRKSFVRAPMLPPGTYGFVMWYIPSGHTFTTRKVFTEAENWSIETFENKAPDMQRVLYPQRFHIT